MMRSRLVLQTQRHLKWPVLDVFEAGAMVICGIAISGFTTSVFFDVLTRTLGHPWLWLQEVTSTFFVYGVFIGAAAATRRNDHLYLSAITESMTGATRIVVETFNRLVVLAVALCMIYFGYINFLQGFGNFRMPSMTPLASYYAVIPLSGVFIALFTVEQLVNGWRNGFASPQSEPRAPPLPIE
ncbi:MAG TPA: TRAP transporter small permease [Stellaceae bacterium]|nr:TRAP transporter small permease [Stellaceae bacterium]